MKIKIPAVVDPHVHLRWNEYPEATKMAFEDAQWSGVVSMGEMPNTSPALTDPQTLYQRSHHLHEAWEEVAKTVDHLGMPTTWVNGGLTKDMAQVRLMASLQQLGIYSVKALKVFFTHSTGDMGILDRTKQAEIWKTLAACDYRGVVMGHFENESLYEGLFSPDDPASHSRRQTPASETDQVERQLRNALDAGFRGVFYICHVSNPDTIDLVLQVRRISPFKIVIEATWHHLLLATDDYAKHGNRVKMNPPLRGEGMRRRLVGHLMGGAIDIIATDHAPHPLAKKDSVHPPSGIPALLFWPRGIEYLRKIYGIDNSKIRRMVQTNAAMLFDTRLAHLGRSGAEYDVEVEYDPSRWDRYGWNPFSRIDEILG